MGRSHACTIAFLFAVVVTALFLWVATTTTPSDIIIDGEGSTDLSSLFRRWFVWSQRPDNSINTKGETIEDPSHSISENLEDVTASKVQEETEERTANKSVSTTSTTASLPIFSENEILQMQQQLRPQVFRTMQLPPPQQGVGTTTRTGFVLLPHQFFHLHHMKTGGTSMDALIDCGLARLKRHPQVIQVNYTNIHECGESNYLRCKSGENQACHQNVRNAAIMSYCAPLKDLQQPFTWEYQNHPSNKKNDPSSSSSSLMYRPAALTVFRHPVARVWSMFRFQTKSCYGCRELKEIYRDLDRSNDANLTRICKLQLLNHQTRNLMSSDPENEIPSTDEHSAEAIANMKNVFTMIGLTEDMPNTTYIAGRVFPWLTERVTSWSDVLDFANQTAKEFVSTDSCVLPHRNASPKNNRCIDNSKHWDLPDIPDEETTQAIMQHNQLDMRLYEAAVRQFELQKIALGLQP
jgi:hypothetical protein